MQEYPRLHARSRSLFGRTFLLLSPLFASGSTGRSMPTAAARAFELNMDHRHRQKRYARLLKLALWLMGCLAFLGAMMVLSHIAIIHSIR